MSGRWLPSASKLRDYPGLTASDAERHVETWRRAAKHGRRIALFHVAGEPLEVGIVRTF